jgi:hypothetical protein
LDGGEHQQRSVGEVGYLLSAALRHMDGAATAGLIMDVRRGAQGAPAGARCREEVPHLGDAVKVAPLLRSGDAVTQASLLRSSDDAV